jgi:hypothetical protein
VSLVGEGAGRASVKSDKRVCGPHEHVVLSDKSDKSLLTSEITAVFHTVTAARGVQHPDNEGSERADGYVVYHGDSLEHGCGAMLAGMASWRQSPLVDRCRASRQRCIMRCTMALAGHTSYITRSLWYESS